MMLHVSFSIDLSIYRSDRFLSAPLSVTTAPLPIYNCTIICNSIVRWDSWNFLGVILAVQYISP